MKKKNKIKFNIKINQKIDRKGKINNFTFKLTQKPKTHKKLLEEIQLSQTQEKIAINLKTLEWEKCIKKVVWKLLNCKYFRPTCNSVLSTMDVFLNECAFLLKKPIYL